MSLDSTSLAQAIGSRATNDRRRAIARTAADQGAAA